MTVHEESSILVSYIVAHNHLKIGCITLNKPKALHALDLDMIQCMQQQLDKWRNDDDIIAVFIDSVGERAFCAGGDIVSMYHAMEAQKKAAPTEIPDFTARFFAHEYRLDYSIHVFPKPIICWGNGIIMGGGLGVFAGASHKVVTESARVAMPEITIGLFPDVGASYFLNRMPAGVGRFMGLTAASMNAVDCLNIGLADCFVLHSAKSSFLNDLCNLKIISSQTITELSNVYQNQANTLTTLQAINGNLSEFNAKLPALDSKQNLAEIEAYLKEIASEFSQNKTLQKGIASFIHGSPISAHLVIEELKRGAKKTLAECFQMELGIAYQCSVTGELQEGIRALMIDKDNQPKWCFEHHEEVPQAVIESHFNRYSKNAQEGELNPLHSLEQEYGVSHA